MAKENPAERHSTDRKQNKTSKSGRDVLKDLSRRNVLKTTGALGTFALSPSTVAADDGVSVKEAGIAEEFNQQIKAGKTDEAFALLEEYNVNYTKATDTLSSDDGDVSTEDYYETSNSSVTFYTSEWDASKDQYAIGLSWTLENANNDADGPAPVDVPVLGFEQDVFGYVDDSVQVSGTLEDYDGSPSANGLTTVLSEPGSADPDAPDNGLVAEFDDNFRNADLDDDGYVDFYPVGQGVVQIVLRKQNTSTKGIVSGLYTHTWSVFNVSEYNVLTNVSIPIPGTGISVTVPDGADKWQLPNSNNRDEDL